MTSVNNMGDANWLRELPKPRMKRPMQNTKSNQLLRVRLLLPYLRLTSEVLCSGVDDTADNHEAAAKDDARLATKSIRNSWP
jgi:hypothetical protein